MSQANVELVRVTRWPRLSSRQLRFVLRYPGAFALSAQLVLLVPSRWWPGRDVELVRVLQPAPDVDIAQLFRNDKMWAAFTNAIGPVFRRDFECVAAVSVGETTYAGLVGLREAWLDWLRPWVTYRTEVEEITHLGPRVLVLYQNFGRLEVSAEEIKTDNAAIWTFRGGMIARAAFYADRGEALKAAEMEDGDVSEHQRA